MICGYELASKDLLFIAATTWSIVVHPERCSTRFFSCARPAAMSHTAPIARGGPPRVILVRHEKARGGGPSVTYVIAEPCVDLLDKACIEECPVDCIYEGARMLYIHPDECVDCGACEPVCPVEAIYYEDDVKEEWAAYTKANVDFFDELGSPGGASKVGVIHKDHPLVMAEPFNGHAE